MTKRDPLEPFVVIFNAPMDPSLSGMSLRVFADACINGDFPKFPFIYERAVAAPPRPLRDFLVDKFCQDLDMFIAHLGFGNLTPSWKRVKEKFNTCCPYPKFDEIVEQAIKNCADVRGEITMPGPVLANWDPLELQMLAHILSDECITIRKIDVDAFYFTINPDLIFEEPSLEGRGPMAIPAAAPAPPAGPPAGHRIP